MRIFMPTKLVKKSMIGRPGDFLAFDGNIYNGRLVSIKRGFAEFLYTIPGEAGEFRTLLPVRSQRLEMY